MGLQLGAEYFGYGEFKALRHWIAFHCGWMRDESKSETQYHYLPPVELRPKNIDRGWYLGNYPRDEWRNKRDTIFYLLEHEDYDGMLPNWVCRRLLVRLCDIRLEIQDQPDESRYDLRKSLDKLINAINEAVASGEKLVFA